MKEKILQLLFKKQLRYITPKYLGEDLYTKVLSLTSFLDDQHNLSERLYCIINDITEHPKCPYCKIYTHSKFKGIKTLKEGYLNKYCCISHSRKRKFKTQPTCLNPSCNNEVKTKNNLYCSNKCYSMCPENALEKRIKTNIKKYGVDNVSKTSDVLNKIKSTKLLRYNDENYNNQERNTKHRYITTYQSILKRFKNIVIPLFTVDEYKGQGFDNIYKWQCVNCNHIYYSWYMCANIKVCPKCNPILNGRSKAEIELNEYILNIINEKTITNIKSIISPLELDIYIPEKKIAIEYNGLHWHSDLFGDKDKHYHLNKTLKCQEKNIQLIHIFEDEWFYKKQIVKNRLKHILRKCKYSIYGRKCIIKEISTQLKNKFLDKYHIQGKDNSSIKLGAYYKDRLVAVMTFGKCRIALGKKNSKEGEYELMRFCTVGNFNIIGIAGKLLKHFERNYNPTNIISYADRRWSTGNLYHQLGFTETHITKPNYWYLHKNDILRLYRFNYRKNVLENKLETFDPTLTEWQNMQVNGFDRIWDCGNYCFKKNY